MKRFSALLLALIFVTQTHAMTVNEFSSYDQLEQVSESFDTNGEQADQETTGVIRCDEEAERNTSPLPDEFEDLNPTTNDKPINFCKKKLLYGGERMSKREKKKLKRKMRRQCKKKAKAYKRAVARELLGNLQLGRFVQAAFKSKKKIMRNSGTSTNRLDLSTDIDPALVQNMTKEQFSEYMMARIRQQVPTLDALMEQSKNPDNAFTGAFDRNESFPMNVVISGANGNKCVVKGDEFPEEEEFEPETCELCENVNIQDSFHNDCSYMVGGGLSEGEARSLVGASSEKAAAGSDQYCNQEPEAARDGVRQLKDTADKLCDIAKEGLTPNFEIEASRNLYNDYTPDLAAKRGDFTREYLFDRLQKKCKGVEDAPAWLSDPEKFADVVRVKHPEYARPNNTPGNYGPNPYATGDEIDQELKYLEETLDRELAQLNDQISELNEKKASIESELAAINIKIEGGNGQKGIRDLYDSVKKNMDRPDFRLLEDQTVVMSQYIHEAEMAYAQKKKLKQDLHDVDTRIASLRAERSKPKFKKSATGYNMVINLGLYYVERDSIGANNLEFRKKWDEELFNQFKMARITGSVEKVNEFGVPEELMTPELQMAMKSLVQIQSYTCELSPISTKKVTLEGILKAPLKVISALTLPAVAVIGAGVTVAASPITTGISLFCKGCREPGTTPPILMLGNLFHLDLSKSGRKKAWKATKGFISNYVNWGGALKVKGNREIRVHQLRDYARKKGGKAYDDMNPEEQDQLIDQVIAEVEAAALAEQSRKIARHCEDNIDRYGNPEDGDNSNLGSEAEQDSGNSAGADQDTEQ